MAGTVRWLSVVLIGMALAVGGCGGAGLVSTPPGIAGLYVANLGSITVYAAGANGNAAPIRTISGAATGLSAPWFIFLRP